VVLKLPETLRDESVGVDAEKGIVCGSCVKAGHLGVGEERIWPPDAA